jgi:hypothetical protein
MNTIVTRNVNNDKENGHFAARHLDEQTLTTRKNVLLRNAEVTETYKDSRFKVERNFGCGTIIVGELAPAAPSEHLASLEQIEFDGSSFCTHLGRTWVRSARVIVFTESGKIFAGGINYNHE